MRHGATKTFNFVCYIVPLSLVRGRNLNLLLNRKTRKMALTIPGLPLKTQDLSMNQRLIFGCGYVGRRVGKIWAGQGDTVYAVTRYRQTFPKFVQAGFKPLLADVTDAESITDLPTAATVLIAVGFDRSRYDKISDVYVDGIKNLLARLPADTRQIIYISSTGVYGQNSGEPVNEQSPTVPTRPGGIACLEAESILRSSPFSNRTTILRFAGIYGPGRLPGKKAIESQTWNQLSNKGLLNLIHVDDGVQIINTVARQQILEQTYIVSDGTPALREDYYNFLADQLSMAPIPWASVQTAGSGRRSQGAGKMLDNRKLTTELNPQLKFPDYRTGIVGTLTSTDTSESPTEQQ